MRKLPQGEKKYAAVQQMFNSIAPTYDKMNRMMTFGLDQPWRRFGLDRVHVGPGDILLDIACGTGDLAALAQKRGAMAMGLDYAEKMLQVARVRQGHIPFLKGDANQLPFQTASIDVIVSGFALRNFVNLETVIDEMGRVLAPGGRLMLLEVSKPRNAFIRMCHSFYFEKIVPLLGALLADKNAYQYLPDSVAYLPSESALLMLIEKAGFCGVKQHRLMFGTTQVITGVRKDKEVHR